MIGVINFVVINPAANGVIIQPHCVCINHLLEAEIVNGIVGHKHTGMTDGIIIPCIGDFHSAAAQIVQLAVSHAAVFHTVHQHGTLFNLMNFAAVQNGIFAIFHGYRTLPAALEGNAGEGGVRNAV